MASVFSLKVYPYKLYFKRPAGTSRGVYSTRDVWYLHLTAKDQSGRVGIGECAPLPDLSCDFSANYESVLQQICSEVAYTGNINKEWLTAYPSILFGLETAFEHFNSGSYAFYDTAFARGKKSIPINGLIWMGEYDYMFNQIKDKINKGFDCIKLKIGAINFEEELQLLKYIRTQFSVHDIEIRVDANGAFEVNNALEKLSRLADLNIHSIEQPIKQGQIEQLARLIELSPLPIALDEELIGVNNLNAKQSLLDTVNPHYIVLKPTLHGGLSGCDEWVTEAKKRHIKWWVTSALESNVGLNAIAQWCGRHKNNLPQGLGTGALFINNMEVPLKLKKNNMWFKV